MRRRPGHADCLAAGVTSGATSLSSAARLRRQIGCALALLAGLMLGADAAAGDAAADAQALRERHAELQQALSQSPFQRPLVLRSGTSDSAPQGDVYALLDHPFAAVAASLREASSWCEILILQTNVKRCVPEAGAAGAGLRVRIARKYTDPVEDAHAVDFDYRVQAVPGAYLRVELAAAEGPVGTRDYRLQFEATPVGERQTFVHLAYAYEAGLAARLATRAYLASAGRDKIGFSVAGHDASGRPVHVGGIQGVAERNTMRYFLAIEAFLATSAVAPPRRPDERLRLFHAALERYPAQLHETSLDEYLAMKLREAGRR
jgi:hypothetical protein